VVLTTKAVYFLASFLSAPGNYFTLNPDPSLSPSSSSSGSRISPTFATI
jgi:hypothetical protein